MSDKFNYDAYQSIMINTVHRAQIMLRQFSKNNHNYVRYEVSYGDVDGNVLRCDAQ
jgi:hypothetical protein